ncbi:hypothetical protein [Maritalea sp.]|uniref:hypothetical protein n=1 Tax=Maritalea sp. TaxID=2003361 RepID=UPI003EF6BAF3
MSNDKETVVVTNHNSAGWFVAAIAVMAVLVMGYLAYTGYFSNSEQVSIELKVPEVLTPSE